MNFAALLIQAHPLRSSGFDFEKFLKYRRNMYSLRVSASSLFMGYC